MLDNEKSHQIQQQICQYLEDNQINSQLPKISYEILSLQLLESIQKDANIKSLLTKTFDKGCCNPDSATFNPFKAIVYYKDSNYDEACWLSFLMIYTDDSERNNWQFLSKIYKGVGLNLNQGLTWQAICERSNQLDDMFETLSCTLAESNPKPKFGHHRAYESLKHLPVVFQSYVNLINEHGGHHGLLQANESVRMDLADYRSDCFKVLYSIIRQNLYRFGRLSTFEYLCLLGKMELADIEPDSCYIAEASGPKRGAKLLFGIQNDDSIDDYLDQHSVALADYLQVGYQQMEAALCHWQKSPNRFLPHG